MLERLVKAFILWAVRRTAHAQRSMDQNRLSFFRYAFLWEDEWVHNGKTWHRPPWYRPFNALLHLWRPQHGGEEFHDHPRWSITICLRGCLIERTPWAERTLTPGSIVIRSRKRIHSFHIPPEHRGKTWTLFIVGRRNYRQNRYRVVPQNLNTAAKDAEWT